MANTTLRRLDKLLVDRGAASSREAAKALISQGRVKVSGFLQNKPASMFPGDVSIEVTPLDQGESWVSRGAHKLIKGLDTWGLDPSGLDCTDIGASTGGFTQVLLRRGARRVAAVDVGYGQLAWSLRNDPRVTVFERTNARYITPEDIGWRAALLSVDASFISLRLLLPNLRRLISEDGTIVALVKPQFEVGRERVGKGVVRARALHLEVLETVAHFAETDAGLALRGATYSPILGPEGNVEFMFWLDGAGESAPMDFPSLVDEAYVNLGIQSA